MKVKELIRELKKMPQGMRVGVAMGDNSEGEVAGWPSSVSELEETDMGTGFGTPYPEEKTGQIVVIIHC